MDHGHHHHHQQQQQQLHHLHHHQYSAAASGSNIDPVNGSDNRFPQWSIQETQELLVVRAELDRAFIETKRNKVLWDEISGRMKDKGYNRSGEQCKCKWKNLVTRFKGCETMEAEGMRQQFPFYSQLQTIFAARMQRMLWQEAEGGSAGGGTSRQQPSAAGGASQFSSSDEDEDAAAAASEGDKAGAASGSTRSRKRKMNANPPPQRSGSAAILGGIREMMDEYLRQQVQMEARWLEAHERREEERRAKEAEWRMEMEALENERVMMERRWREREEQRREREEQRAEKRDALITALLNKLGREDS